MLEKVCPFCGRKSYSSSDRGTWICPYCSRDITIVPSRPAGK